MPNEDNTTSTDITWFRGKHTDLSRTGIPFFWFLVVGCLALFVFGGAGKNMIDGAKDVARWLMIAGGMVIGGIATGFLFAIPRTIPPVRLSNAATNSVEANLETAPTPAGTEVHPEHQITLPSYRVNSNLEQISDWLTKIIVGVGLTQLHNLPALMLSACIFLAGGPESAPSDRAFALAIILYFSIVGFVAGYLFTRIYITGAFVRAERWKDRES